MVRPDHRCPLPDPLSAWAGALAGQGRGPQEEPDPPVRTTCKTCGRRWYLLWNLRVDQPQPRPWWTSKPPRPVKAPKVGRAVEKVKKCSWCGRKRRRGMFPAAGDGWACLDREACARRVGPERCGRTDDGDRCRRRPGHIGRHAGSFHRWGVVSQWYPD